VAATNNPGAATTAGDLAQPGLKPADIFPAYGRNIGPPIKAIRSSWNVPGPRANENINDNGQVDLWTGLQRATGLPGVLQPVTELWASTDGSWQMKPVYNMMGNVMQTGAITNVNNGDVILGYVTGSNCNSSTGVCTDWDVQVVDQTAHVTTPALHVTGFTDPQVQVIGAALELHTNANVTSCLQFPARRTGPTATTRASATAPRRRASPPPVRPTRSCAAPRPTRRFRPERSGLALRAAGKGEVRRLRQPTRRLSVIAISH